MRQASVLIVAVVSLGTFNACRPDAGQPSPNEEPASGPVAGKPATVSLNPLGFRTSGALGAYWIYDVGIGDQGNMKHVQVPIADILKFKNADGTVQTNVVYLSAATFDLSSPTYLSVPQGIADQLTVPAGGTSNVAKLQAEGIKVVLTVVGDRSGGWQQIPPARMAEVAVAIRKYLDDNGLDGIDIDDEYSNQTPTGQGLVDMVANLRAAFDGSSLTISKALWNDEAYFKTAASSAGGKYAGAYLGQLLDMGSSMSYFAGLQIEDITAQYADVTVTIGGQSVNVGIPKDRLFMGVQAGTSQGTSCSDSYTLGQQSIGGGFRGMLLFTFSQDIQQFTYGYAEQPFNNRQNEIMWPDEKYDHQWQRALVEGMRNPGSTTTGLEACKPLTPPAPGP